MEYYNQKAKFLPGNKYFNNLNSHIAVNSDGYRTLEFENINWPESIVLFGCSMAFGTGLTEEETVSYKLSKLLGKTVVNLGVPASSILYSVYNQLALKEMNVKPFAVINLWTAIERHTYFLKNNPVDLGPWITNDDIGRQLSVFYYVWSQNEHNIKSNAVFFQRLTNLLWQDTTHIQASFFESTSKLFEIPLLKIEDFAQDNEHPGPATAKTVAEQLAVWCR